MLFYYFLTFYFTIREKIWYLEKNVEDQKYAQKQLLHGRGSMFSIKQVEQGMYFVLAKKKV